MLYRYGWVLLNIFLRASAGINYYVYDDTNVENSLYIPRSDGSSVNMLIHMPLNAVSNRTTRDLITREQSSLAAEGSGASLLVAAAAGTWATVTIGSCGSCALTASANIAGCVICGAGMVGSLIAGTLACVLGDGCKDGASVLANASKRSVTETGGDGSEITYHYLGESVCGQYENYARVDTNRTHIVASMKGELNPHDPVTSMLIVRGSMGKARRDDDYRITWVSYEYDNWNIDSTGFFYDAYESNPDYFNERVAMIFGISPTTKYCMSLVDGGTFIHPQNAVHGEMYTNNYGGVDGFCNNNDDNLWANRCFQAWEDGGYYSEDEC